MRNTIADLWNGNLAPYEQCGAHDPKVRELAGLMEKNRIALCRELSAEQKKAFEIYADSSDELLLCQTEHAFCDGFSLAGRLLTEALGENS